jgi:hypothetical protein
MGCLERTQVELGTPPRHQIGLHHDHRLRMFERTLHIIQL